MSPTAVFVIAVLTGTVLFLLRRNRSSARELRERTELLAGEREEREALLARVATAEAEHGVLAAAIASMREGLLVVGPNRRVEIPNAAARTVLELSFDPVGRPLTDVLRHPDALALVDRSLSGQTESDWDSTKIRTGVSDRTFQLRAAPILESGNEGGSSTLLLILDISDLERLETVRRDFVTNVSHELRTPLAAIRAAVETLIDEAPEGTHHPLLEIANRNAMHMSALADELTDLSQIETGSISLEIRDTDATEVTHSVVERLKQLAHDAEVRLDVSLPAPFPVRADRYRLEEMMTNLIDNGIKFSRPGGRVRISGSRSDAETRLIVEDEGEGIPEASRERIFNRFYQVGRDRSRSGGRRGTGLGLAIVKHLMRLHGGTVEVESELGQGSRFQLRFPAAPASL